MADPHIHLADLSSHETWRLLAEAADLVPGIALARIRCQIPESSFGLRVHLWIPVSADGQSDVRVYDPLINNFMALGLGNPQAKPLPEKNYALAQVLAWLLLNAPQDEDSPPDRTDEMMVVARNLEPVDVQSIFEHLAFHATAVRVAAAERTAGRAYFFHVRDDQARRSSLQSAMAGGLLEGAGLLRGFRVEPFTVFLPDEAMPNQFALEAFARLFRYAPKIFGISKLIRAAGPLAALIGQAAQGSSRTRKQRMELLYLGRLTFHNRVDLTPLPAMAEVQIHDLQDSFEALARLQTDLRHARPRVGYRLALQPLGVTGSYETERRRLHERIAEMEYKLAYLESMEQPRPTLLRFTARQLPGLADVLRGFPLRVLQEGLIRYGFQSSKHQPGGWHYLFFEARDAVLQHLDPLVYWRDLDSPPMRFWLDPFWARYYHGRGPNALVFVPEGMGLFPAMHDWDSATMDQYLRRSVSQWFGKSNEEATLPEQPIYLFDQPADAKDKILVSVLDLEKFEPLHTQLDWLNDNLLLVEELGLARVMGEMADTLRSQELAGEVRQRARASLEKFEEIARQAAESVAQRMTTLTQVFSEETARLAMETFNTSTEMGEMEEGLRRLTRVKKDMREIAETTENQLGEAMSKTDLLSAELRNLEKKINESLRARNRVNEQVNDEIRNLRKLHDELREKFTKMLRLE